MLQALHSTASGLFAKILLFLLVASFALWGIGDIFRSSPGDALVTVGDDGVTAYEFQHEYAKEQANFRRMLGNNYSNELLTSLGVPEQVMNRLIEKHLLREESRNLGLTVPESHLMKLLKDNPNFRGEDGQFDAGIFRNVLANNNLNESMYLQLLEDDVTASMLVDGAVVGLNMPDVASRLHYLHQHETRTADVLIFPKTLIHNLPEPSDEELAGFYEEQKSRFTTEEARRFAMLILDYQALAQKVEVPDEELLVAYQDRIDEFRDPELREIEQLLLPTPEKADAALKALKDGMTLEKAAQEFETINDELSLGKVSAESILPEAEDAVFSLEKGGYTEPVESAFGWHIFHVKSIEPEKTRALAEVKKALQDELKTEWAQEEIYELSNRVQDELAVGTPMEDVASELGIAMKTFGPLTREGTTLDGKDVPLPEGFEGLVETVFGQPEKEVSTLIETPDGSFYAVRVEEVLPSQAKPLDEIKATVTKEWKEAETGRQLAQLAEGVAGQLMSEDIASVAQKTGATLLKSQELSRTTTQLAGGKNVPAPLVVELFASREGSPTSAIRLQDGSYMVAKLKNVESPDDSSKKARAKIAELQQSLSAQISNEIYAQYMAYLHDKYNVSSVNQAALQSLLPE